MRHRPETGRPAYEKLALAQASAKAWALAGVRLAERRTPQATVLRRNRRQRRGLTRADRLAVTQMLASLDSNARRARPAHRGHPVEGAREPACCRNRRAGGSRAVGLNMLGMMQLLRHEEVDKMLVASTAAASLTKGVGGSTSTLPVQVWSGSTIGTGDQVDQTAHAFFGRKG